MAFQGKAKILINNNQKIKFNQSCWRKEISVSVDTIREIII
jgi:hypothetical protein